MPGISDVELKTAMEELLRDTPHYKGKRVEAWAAVLDAEAEAFARREKEQRALLSANKMPVKAAQTAIL
jgi:hypothetical protein